jgi:signal transduction histidine kinase
VNEAVVTLWQANGRLHVNIEDQGAGFDLDTVLDGQRSSGLIGMRERIGLLGGTLSIETAPGQGTTLSIDFPLTSRSGA